MKEIYQANDGTQFEKKKDCLQHEKLLDNISILRNYLINNLKLETLYDHNDDFQGYIFRRYGTRNVNIIIKNQSFYFYSNHESLLRIRGSIKLEAFIELLNHIEF